MRTLLPALVIAVGFATACPAHAAMLLRDTFDTDTVGSFPAGWDLSYDGAGTSLQVVDNTYAVSKPNSLKLVGSSCWAAQAYHPIAVPAPTEGVDQHVQLSAAVFVGEIGVGGCSNITAQIAFWNTSVQTFGAAYADVQFLNNNTIVTPGSSTVLGTYVINRWYTVAIDADLTAQTFEISVNGVLLATGVPFTLAGTPPGVMIDAGHGQSPIVYYDNITVQTPKLAE